MSGEAQQGETRSMWVAWMACAWACLTVLIVVRLVTGAGAAPITWDEKYALPIIERIWRTEWWSSALLDYDDTKGPAFFWLYAAAGEFFGRSVAVLRAVSLVCTALWAATLVGLLGLRERTAARFTLVMGLALMLPYALVMSQLVMSEPSFLLGCAIMAAAAVGSLGSERPRLQRLDGPIIFGILFAVLLHHRIHVVALAGGIVLIAAQRQRWRSWPWLVAGLLAGLSRLPLYLRWGGLVGESFQHRYSIGLRLDSLAYLSAALLPTIGLALVAAGLRRRELGRQTIGLIVLCGAAGAGLVAIAPPAISSDPQALNFAGPVATLLRPIADAPMLLAGVLAALSALGAMSLASLAALTAEHARDAEKRVQIGSWLALLTIVLGWLLSALAAGDVYDRYLLGFTFLWPVLCVRVLPRPLVIVQLLGQSAIAAMQVWGRV